MTFLITYTYIVTIQILTGNCINYKAINLFLTIFSFQNRISFIATNQLCFPEIFHCVWFFYILYFQLSNNRFAMINVSITRVDLYTDKGDFSYQNGEIKSHCQRCLLYWGLFFNILLIIFRNLKLLIVNKFVLRFSNF